MNELTATIIFLVLAAIEGFNERRAGLVHAAAVVLLIITVAG